MMTLTFVAAGAGLLVLAAVVPLIGLWRTLSLALLVALALVPYPAVALALDQVHYGIADGIYTPTSYSIALAAVVVAGLRQREVRLSIVLSAGFLVYLSILTILLWGNTAAQWSGNIHLVTALLAVGAGAAIGHTLLKDSTFRLLWVSVTLGILVIQALASAAQLSGIPLSLFTNDVSYFIKELRPIGTFNHPSVIGKTVLVLLIVVLPFTRDARRATSRIAWAAVLVGVAVTAATQARSNIAAVLVAVVLWVLFDNRRSIKRRLITAGVAALASVPVALTVIPRFLSDPGGGDRPELLSTGLQQIASAPFLGIGANSYSAVVGQWDELAASGFPVHNTFLLATAELGALGAIMLFVPLVWQFVSAARSWSGTGLARGASVASLVALPGLALVTMTGWGMLTEGALVLWYFSIGISIGLMRRIEAPEDDAWLAAQTEHNLAPQSRREARSARANTTTAPRPPLATTLQP